MTATATPISPQAIGEQDFQTLAALNKAAGDPLRLEILRLLRTESMGVLELTAVFDSKQSGMSHHLKVLARTGLVTTRREGNSIFYRRALPPAEDSLGDYIRALFQAIDAMPLSQAVQARLDDIRAQRGEQSRAFFARHFHEFRLHQEMIAEHELYARSVLDMLGSIQLPAHDTALELGPGEGCFLPALSEQFRRVLAVDNSADMLDQARTTATSESLDNVEFVLGETSDLLTEYQQSVDCLIANMVLHHIPQPDTIFRHAAAILKPGGSLVISELSAHDQHWVRESCGDLWLGFREEELTEWAQMAGLTTGESQYLGLRNGFQIQVRCFRRPKPIPYSINNLLEDTEHMAEYSLFTSESVSEGHPDKIADQISDAILDAMLTDDPESRVAVETMVKTGIVIVAGEVRTNTYVDIEDLVRQVVKDIGYNNGDLGFDGDCVAVLNAIGKQSQDIAMGVDETSIHEQGAGDQGLMFGYATNETDVLMPAPIYYAHQLVKRQAEVRKNGQLPWLRPDAKSQVTLRYSADGKPVAIDAVVLSTQHSPNVSQEELHNAVLEEIIRPVLPAEWLSSETRYHINPTGNFVIGGPVGDCGLTGRKIIVDTYGGMARHGGGAFSGKDPSKVDRSAAYAGRYVAKNIVAAGLADRCEIQVSYAIGVAEPTSISINTFGTGKVSDERIGELVREHFDLRPKGLIQMLDLKRPIYQVTAAYGHFGREEKEFTWEATDKADTLKKAAGL